MINGGIQLLYGPKPFRRNQFSLIPVFVLVAVMDVGVIVVGILVPPADQPSLAVVGMHPHIVFGRILRVDIPLIQQMPVLVELQLLVPGVQRVGIGLHRPPQAQFLPVCASPVVGGIPGLVLEFPGRLADLDLLGDGPALDGHGRFADLAVLILRYGDGDLGVTRLAAGGRDADPFAGLGRTDRHRPVGGRLEGDRCRSALGGDGRGQVFRRGNGDLRRDDRLGAASAAVSSTIVPAVVQGIAAAGQQEHRPRQGRHHELKFDMHLSGF